MNLPSRLIFCFAMIISLALIIVGCNGTTQIPISTSKIENTLSPTKIPPSSAGPWLVITNENQLYALNEDGTGLTSLVPELSVWQVTSPSQTNIVAVLASRNDRLSYTITLMNLPQGNIVDEIPLLSFFVKEPAIFDDGPTGPLGGIGGRGPSGGMKWSPDGRYLAFMGAIEDSQSSLYIYDSQTQAIKRLSHNQYQGVDPKWSSDGKWIVYEEVSDFHGWQTQGIWAASINGEELKLLYRPTGSIAQEILGWVGNDNFVVADSGMDGERNIRLVNITTGNIEGLYSGYYSGVSTDKNGAVVFSPLIGAPGVGSKLEQGWYLVSPDILNPRPLIQPEESFISSLTWDSSTELFVSDIPCNGEPEKIVAFDSTGETICVVKPKPYISPDGAWYIAKNEQLAVYQANGEKMGDFSGDSSQIIWRPDSGGFFLVIDNEIHHVSLPSLDSQNVYQSQNGYFSFLWVGVQ